jgi:hypothetical protein
VRLEYRAHFYTKLVIVCLSDSVYGQTEGWTIFTNYIKLELIYILVEKLMLTLVTDWSVTRYVELWSFVFR